MNAADKLREALEQARVQLAGCGVAALGGTKDPAKKGAWGWSPAYQDTLNLRLKYEASQQRVETLTVAINKVWEVASGECQVAMDDTQGMEWISDYLSSIEDIADAVAALSAPTPEQPSAPLTVQLEENGVLVEDPLRNLSVLQLVEHDSFRFKCPFCEQLWSISTQEWMDRLEDHLRLAHASQKEGK